MMSIIACTMKKTTIENRQTSFNKEPHVLIYKTKQDYSQLVPITLSADKSTIASYPHPWDLYTSNSLAKPVKLKNGYFLDNRGINGNTAFVKFTYEVYTSLSVPPKTEELFKNIIDNDPITELWDCGPKTNYTNIEKQINKLIDYNKLENKCIRIK